MKKEVKVLNEWDALELFEKGEIPVKREDVVELHRYCTYGYGFEEDNKVSRTTFFLKFEEISKELYDVDISDVFLYGGHGYISAWSSIEMLQKVVESFGRKGIYELFVCVQPHGKVLGKAEKKWLIKPLKAVVDVEWIVKLFTGEMCFCEVDNITLKGDFLHDNVVYAKCVTCERRGLNRFKRLCKRCGRILDQECNHKTMRKIAEEVLT